MQSAGSAAEQAADRKCLKYAEQFAAYEFQSAAVDTYCPINDTTDFFLSDLSSHISERLGDPFEVYFLFNSRCVDPTAQLYPS